MAVWNSHEQSPFRFYLQVLWCHHILFPEITQSMTKSLRVMSQLVTQSKVHMFINDQEANKRSCRLITEGRTLIQIPLSPKHALFIFLPFWRWSSRHRCPLLSSSPQLSVCSVVPSSFHSPPAHIHTQHGTLTRMASHLFALIVHFSVFISSLHLYHCILSCFPAVILIVLPVCTSCHRLRMHILTEP